MPPRPEELESWAPLGQFLQGIEANVDQAVGEFAGKIDAVLDAVMAAGYATATAPGLLAAGLTEGLKLAADWLAGSLVNKDLARGLRDALVAASAEPYCHHGPYVRTLDYMDAQQQRVQSDRQCAAHDIDR